MDNIYYNDSHFGEVKNFLIRRIGDEKMENIYIYSDKQQNFSPLALLKPVFELRCGAFTFKERIKQIYQKEIHEIQYPASKAPELIRGMLQYPEKGLFINGRVLLWERLPEKEAAFVSNNEIIGFRIEKQEVKGEELERFLDKTEKIEVEALVVDYPWDLIRYNREALIKDIELFKKSKVKSQKLKVIPGVYFIEKEGPVYIESDVQLKPPTIIEGPCYIGSESLIDGAKIREGVSIGKCCKIGGEVGESIFSDFSNKRHEGFIGDSYVGEWVNLGALTTNSNLKNTYGTVKVQSIDTGLLKLGVFIGDHAKTGIGTLLTTGCVVGCFANIYDGGVFPKYIPSFVWGTKDKLVEYELEKAIEVARRVMARRNIEMSKEYEERIREAFKLTHKEREKH